MPGEVVGLVGLRGAGQESIGRALFGLHPITAGRGDARRGGPGRNLAARGDGERHQPGLRRPGGRVRHADALRPREPVPQSAGGGPRHVFLPGAGPGEPRRAARSASASACAPTIRGLAIELLSGGNQQKVVVGRWLHLEAKIYIFEDPTAGVDVGAKGEIYRLFDVALRAGAAIIIVSTDFEEIAKVCHRALVFDRGRAVAELGAADLSVENLLAAASARVGRMAEAVDSHANPGAGPHAVH